MSQDPALDSDQGQLPSAARRRRTSTVNAQILRCVPRTARQGFAEGRAAGRQFAQQDLLFGVGHATGFAVGICEAVVDAIALPMSWLGARIVSNTAE